MKYYFNAIHATKEKELGNTLPSKNVKLCNNTCCETRKKVVVSENGIDNENIACVKVLVKKI